MEIIKKAPDANKLSFGYQEPFIYLLNLWSDRCIHILSVQAVNNPVGQSMVGTMIPVAFTFVATSKNISAAGTMTSARSVLAYTV